MEESQRKEIRKTAKRLIKIAKHHPEWYSESDIYYAKKIRKDLKKEKGTVDTN